MTITLTEKAEFRLRAFLQGGADKNPERGIRVGVTDGGCSGYQYTLDVASGPQEGDVLEENGRLKVYVPAAAAPLLNGIVIDFVDGLMESGFKFSNPNATETCGCGTSFKAGDCAPEGVPCTP